MKLTKKIAVFAVFASLLVLPLVVVAQEEFGLGAGQGFTDTISTTLPGTAGDTNVPTVIARLVNWAMGFLGIIAVVIILAGGFMWMTAAGNEEKVGKAKKLLIAGIIGLVIILAAYIIATYVLSTLKTAITG